MAECLTPVNLTLWVLSAGCLLGMPRRKGFSFGAAGILFVAMGTGMMVRPFAASHAAYREQLLAAMQVLSSLGSSAFAAVIGLEAGMSLLHSRRGVNFGFFVGCLMSCAGYIAVRLIGVWDPQLSRAVQGGILCGALTSTPGLSAICEKKGVVASQAVWGYGCTYPVGVLSAVFAVQLCCMSRRAHPSTDCRSECQLLRERSTDSHMLQTVPSVIAIALCALLGNLIGGLTLPGIGFTLGGTGGILSVGVLFGWGLSAAGHIPLSSVLRTGKNCGLALFFTGNGIAAGLQIHALQFTTVLYGFLVTWAALAIGFLCTCPALKRFRLHRGCVIAGGMTSSPALGMLLQKGTDLPMGQFSAAYFGALLSLTVLLYFL